MFSNFSRGGRWFLRRFAIALLLVLSLASLGWARTATIETRAPLHDHSEQSIKTALKHAVTVAMEHAVAMGLPWVQIHEARVLEKSVAVVIFATDTTPEDAEDEQLGRTEAGARPAPRLDL